MRNSMFLWIGVIAIGCARSMLPSSQTEHTIATVDTQDETVATVDTAPSSTPTSTDSTAGPMTSMVIGFQPLDLASDMSMTPLRLLIDNGGNPVSDSVLDEAAAALAVHTLTGEVVPFTYIKHSPKNQKPNTNCAKPCDASSGPPVSAEKAYVELTLKGLTNTWYELSLTKVPGGCAVQKGTYFAPAKALKWGVAGVRFNPSPDPVLYELGICTKEDGKVSAQLRLSAPVDPKAAADVELSAPNLDCKLVGALGTSPILGYACQGTGKPDALWQVKLTPTVVTMSGLTVHVGPMDAGQIAAVDMAAVAEVSGCRYYRW